MEREHEEGGRISLDSILHVGLGAVFMASVGLYALWPEVAAVVS